MMKNSLWKFTETEKFNLAVIFIFASLVMLPVLIYGVPNGYDMPHHYQTAMTYRDEILAGNFYPSWTNLRNLGYGGMELRLYPPVSHYVLALFSLAVKDWHLATWLSFTFWWVLGSFGVYFWGRELGAPRYALVAALIYAVMPHRLNQAYIVFFYGEFAGSAILPFCFAFAARIARETKSSDDESFSFRKNGLINLNVIGLAISFALLILTHLPLTLIAAFTLVIYCAANAKPNLKYCVGYFSRLATGGILALLATSFFWTKVLQERSILAKATVYEDIFLDYKLNFLLSPFQSYFSSTMPVYEEITLYYNIVLLITLFSIVPVSLLFFSYGNALKNRKSRSVWIVFLSAVFLTTPLSKLIWDNFSLLQEVQFPWRWLSIISLFAAPLTAAGLSVLQTWFTDKRRPFALIFAGTILIGSFFSLSNAIRGAAYTKPKDVASYMEDLNREAGFKFWWTIWTRAEFIQDCDEKVSAGNRGVIIDKWENTERIFTVDDGESIRQIRIATFYHPNWTATVNDVPVEITPDKNGALQIPISTDSSVVKISFQETSIVASARWISGIVWLFLFFWIFRQTRNSFLLTNNNSDPKNAENKIIYNFAYKLFAVAQTNNAWILLLGLATLSVLPVILAGIYNGGDLSQHVQFAATFQSAISSGDFYPSWAANENLGYGSVGVRFYPPLSSFLWALARIILGDWHTATWVIFLFFTVIGSFGIYLWAKEFVSPPKAILAGLIFILMPYHLFEINNASMYAEFAGCSFITFCFLFVTRICRRGNYIDVLGLAVSYAILILTHLPSTVIGSLALFLYALALISKNELWSTLTKLAVSVFLGLSASAVYWTKMVFEMNWMRNTKFWKDSHFDYHFNYLITSPWFDKNQLWLFNLILFSVVVLVSASIACLYLNKDNKTGNGLRGVIVIFFFSIFMTTSASELLWSHIPFLSEVQFPWRWLIISSISGAILAAAGIEHIWKLYSRSKNRKLCWQILIGTLFVSFSLVFALICIQFAINHIPSKDFNNWSVEKSQSIGGEWFWTVITKEETFSVNEKVFAENRETNITKWQPVERVFEVGAGKETTVRVATLFYPHWRAVVNNQPTELYASEDGAINISIPTEHSNVIIWFEEPYYIKIALYTSIITWLAFGLIFSLIYSRKYFTSLNSN